MIPSPTPQELPEEIATGPIVRGFRYKLEPTPKQASLARQFAGACRFVYNIALEQRRDWWRKYGLSGFEC